MIASLRSEDIRWVSRQRIEVPGRLAHWISESRSSRERTLAFAEFGPQQRREPREGYTPARSNRDQPDHIQTADVVESWLPANI